MGIKKKPVIKGIILVLVDKSAAFYNELARDGVWKTKTCKNKARF